MNHAYTVRCEWDVKAARWVMSSDYVPGLAPRADAFEVLVDKHRRVVVPGLLEANGLPTPGEPGDVPLVIYAERHERTRHAA